VALADPPADGGATDEAADAAGAAGKAPPKVDEDLFAELLAADGDGAWRGVLNRILKEKDGAWIGQRLGALLLDPVTYADKAACAAYTAAYMADHPDNGKVLLATAILRRVYRDPAFLHAMQSHLTVGEGGWERLLDAASTLLASEDARSRAVAVWFLGREDGARREAVRRLLLEQAGKDLPKLASEDPGQRALAAAYLDTFRQLLSFDFPAVAEAVKTLDELKDLDLAALIRELSRRKDLPTSPEARTIIDYGKRLVDAVVVARSPAGLEEFLDPTRTPMPQVRRYAVQKALQMEPTADATWTALLVRVLRGEEDADVLRGALDILEAIDFAEKPQEAGRISAALATRLGERGPTGLRAHDATADRVRMARALGALGVPSAELDELLGRTRDLEDEVAAEVIRALGGVKGMHAEQILAHFRAHGEATRRDRGIRIAAVDALGRPGVRASDGDPDVAAAALREILTGEGTLNLGRAKDTEIRQHAIRSLGSYPGEATSKVLQAEAVAGDDAEAGVAIVVLRKAASTDASAVAALREIATKDTAAPSRRVAALQALLSLAKGKVDEGLRTVARQAARDVLGSGAPPEVRMQAARTAAGLADAEALPRVVALWLEDPSRRLDEGVLWDLIEGVAAAGKVHDAALVQTLETLAAKAPWAGVDALVRRLVEAQPRGTLRVARAGLLLDHAGAIAKADPEAARSSLEEADALLSAVLGPQPTEDATGALALRVRALAALGRLAGDDAARKGRYLAAVHLAARSRRREVATQGREIATLLAAQPLAGLLTPEEAKQLAADQAAIGVVLGE